MWLLLLLPIAGFLVGIVASMTGVGGGIFIVPLLTVLFSFIPQHAVGTSLTCIVFTALAATYSYARQGRIFYRTGLLLAITSVPGAYLGAYLTSLVSPSLLGLIFGIFLFFISLRMLYQKRGKSSERVVPGVESPEPGEPISEPQKSDAELMKSPWTLSLAVGLSLFAGMSSGFLGIGGGVLGVPIMTLVLGMPIHFSTATSMFTMVFTSLSGVVKHTLAHHVHLGHALLLALGTVFGAQVGAHFSKRVSARNLRRVFGAVLLLVSIQMIIKFL